MRIDLVLLIGIPVVMLSVGAYMNYRARKSELNSLSRDNGYMIDDVRFTAGK